MLIQQKMLLLFITVIVAVDVVVIVVIVVLAVVWKKKRKEESESIEKEMTCRAQTRIDSSKTEQIHGERERKSACPNIALVMNKFISQ